MTDIIVTTPKRFSEQAAIEAKNLINAGGGWYVRTLRNRPKEVVCGNRIWYTESGFIRGFAVISLISGDSEHICSTTGTIRKGCCIEMLADSWKWVTPTPMKGFQGWRYYKPNQEPEVIGGWLDPMPLVNEDS